ncbi:MAG TPA: VCBS repeat-containing protein [Cyclobacteriaceae bacterium]|nr:VCBS repeat-containing protein [Cyclobacteriaceae bacterium]
MRSAINIVVSILLIGIVGCQPDKAKVEKRFRLIPSSESNVKFRNDIVPSVEFNIFNYMYFYNGAGVATGDLNGDDLVDIYFTGNQQSNRLYLNRGAFKFEDVTDAANAVGFSSWATGVTMADVNADGKLDIYISYLGNYLMHQSRNQLLINEGNDANGVPKFTDRAVAYGLDLVGFSTQAAFFDYDVDGDLDMYMLNHSLHQNGTFGRSSLRTESHPLAGDKLMRNDGNHYTDVTKEAGIYNSVIGYGLGLVVSDVNMDGYPDIYVGNDFHENDYLYINQKNGTFKESLQEQMMHTSHFSMGCDFGDFNNDAFPDLISMDMLPQDPMILKASAAEDTYDLYSFKIGYGYNYQYARNTLQLNQRNNSFSEIGLMAGVYATDWSWSALWADFDLDGFKDIFISNGIERRSNDLDYINFIGEDSIQEKIRNEMHEKEMNYFRKMPQIKIPNALYLNNRDSTFTNMSLEWGLDQPSYSHGAAYADLDNDGDLDLVTNNAADVAFLYENLTRRASVTGQNGFLQVTLKGKGGNRNGLGAKVFLYKSGKVQMQECMATRGFQSAVDTRLTFGLGNTDGVDSAIVVWQDGSSEIIKDIKKDQRIEVDQNNAKPGFSYTRFHREKPLFHDVTKRLKIDFDHAENRFVEFNREGLIPHMVSAEGPAIAVGDANGDGLDDVYLGNAKWARSGLWIQQKSGEFKNQQSALFRSDSTYEEVSAEFFDADKDGDNDLFVVSGGNEWSNNEEYMQPRLLLNDGKGNFTNKIQVPVYLTGSVVASTDFDNDGDVDVFVGARAVPWKYGIKPDSYLLLNDGKGNFSVSETSPVLKGLGFVKDARWADVDGDNDKDLVVASEWSPITILLNDGGKLSAMPLAGSGLENTEGLWNGVDAADFDGDGDLDFIFGNLGLNSKLRTSVEKPVKLFVCDFDKNGSVDQVLTHFIGEKEYPFYTRDEMTKQLPYLKKKYLSYHKFAESSLKDIFSEQELAACSLLVAKTFEHVYVENLGSNKFKVSGLPKASQFSTISGVISGDFDLDGRLDAIVAGNFYGVNVQMGRYDASYGQLLKGSKNGFKAVPPVESGISIPGETRRLRRIRVGNADYILALRNNDTPLALGMK